MVDLHKNCFDPAEGKNVDSSNKSIAGFKLFCNRRLEPLNRVGRYSLKIVLSQYSRKICHNDILNNPEKKNTEQYFIDDCILQAFISHP